MKGIKNNSVLIKSWVIILFWLLGGCSTDSPPQAPIEEEYGNGNTTAETIHMDFDIEYEFVYSDSKVKDRNFYWTTIIENDNGAKSALKDNDELKTFLLNAKQRISNLVGNSGLTAIQYANAVKFTDEEKTSISLAVKEVLNTNVNAFESVNKNHIEPSGAFNHYEAITDVSRVHQLIVEQMMDGINRIIDTYAAGLDPVYPELDGVSYNVNSAQYLSWMQELVVQIDNASDTYSLFYQPFLEFALGVMELNDRDEAGRFIPLHITENAAAFQNLANINWDDYPYSMIVVLGDAPNSPGDLPNISIGGMKRSDHGVKLFNQGLAPIIAFTGANVAPFQSEYHEAIEMKKYVMETHDIPENRILVDPHARHTTTNMRNIGRLIYRYGIPVDKKAIVSTVQSQSEYVTSNGFLTRSTNQMGHIPMDLHERLSDFDIEFTPRIKVLHLNSFDFLDP